MTLWNLVLRRSTFSSRQKVKVSTTTAAYNKFFYIFRFDISCESSSWRWVTLFCHRQRQILKICSVLEVIKLEYKFYNLEAWCNHLCDALRVNSLHAGWFFMLLLSSADFFKINFFKKIFQEHYHSVKQFGSRSGQYSVSPYLVPNCLQRLSADDKSHR